MPANGETAIIATAANIPVDASVSVLKRDSAEAGETVLVSGMVLHRVCVCVCVCVCVWGGGLKLGYWYHYVGPNKTAQQSIQIRAIPLKSMGGAGGPEKM